MSIKEKINKMKKLSKTNKEALALCSYKLKSGKFEAPKIYDPLFVCFSTPLYGLKVHAVAGGKFLFERKHTLDYQI